MRVCRARRSLPHYIAQGGEQAMSTQVQVIDGKTLQPAAAAGEILRLERCIANAERHVAEWEARLRQATLDGHNTAVAEFDLQKLQLLLAILREGRERAVQQLDMAS
jgi:hypothetical protein